VITADTLPDCSAQVRAQMLFIEYSCRYGRPLSMLSNQGTRFKNKLMHFMAKLFGFNHIFSSIYHSQNNGTVEQLNATFVPYIAKLQDCENNN
jgi:transposase InsO family protein